VPHAQKRVGQLSAEAEFQDDGELRPKQTTTLRFHLEMEKFEAGIPRVALSPKERARGYARVSGD
jgi:hypothetical protein